MRIKLNSATRKGLVDLEGLATKEGRVNVVKKILAIRKHTGGECPQEIAVERPCCMACVEALLHGLRRGLKPHD